jgi:hypothetical protein
MPFEQLGQKKLDKKSLSEKALPDELSTVLKLG